MKRFIWILVCCVWISTCSAISENYRKFTALLSDGSSIELVGLRDFSIHNLKDYKDRSYPWWRPDGTVLSVPPDTWTGRTSSSGSYLFVIRVKEGSDYGFRAIGPRGNDLTVQPVDRKAQGFEKDDLRHFSLRFAMNPTQADIKLGVACGDWQVLERWILSEHSTPYSHFFCSSEQVIMRCPEQVGSDVVVEVTQITSERATRLVVFDKDGNEYESLGSNGGESSELVRYIHRFKDMNRNNIERLEFQTRPYDYWIIFKNVSLQLGHNTNVKVEVTRPGYLLPGASLPSFDGMKIGFDTGQSKNKNMLVCFFDMNQRPSRFCLSQLKNMTQELETKGIVVIAIQAAKAEEDNFKSWTEKFNAGYPVGIIQDDTDGIKSIWGIRALPWLILTNNEHVVRAEGFGINELNEKIGELVDAED